MKQSKSIEELLEIYQKAVAEENLDAKSLISEAILEFAEKESLEGSIESKFNIAHKLLSLGSQ